MVYHSVSWGEQLCLCGDYCRIKGRIIICKVIKNYSECTFGLWSSRYVFLQDKSAL